MPLYDFLCENCGHSFSKMLPLGTRETKCHLCGKKAQKQISAPAVHFSGSGFYVSDNRKSGTSGVKNQGTRDTKQKKSEKKN